MIGASSPLRAAPAAHARTWAWIALVACAVFAGRGMSAATTDADYAYRTQPRDTLIGLSRRLLKEPRRWRALRERNAIVDPNHLPLGSVILIPREWMRQQSESATVTTVVGPASSAGVTLKATDPLPEGARIQTGADGYVTIGLADGSVITINPASELELERLRRFEGTGRRDTGLKLDAGSVETHVKPQGDAGRFEIRTPVAISAVRGTEFRRGFDARGELDRTEVVGGTVGVAGDKAAVVVPAGFGTISDAAGGPRTPVKLLAPPELAALPPRLEEEDVRFTFAPVAKAVGYRARIASDREFQSIVAERVVESAELSFATLSDGHYWLSVRSIDAQGLEGADALHEFDRHRLASAPQLIEPRADAFVTGTGAAFRWRSAAGATAYHFQLARDPQFTMLLADREALAPGGANTELVLDSVAPGTAYWRVASIDAGGEPGRWSATEAFRERRPPGVIEAPTVASKSMQLTWAGEPGQHFRVQVARDAAFRHLIDEAEVDSARASFARPFPGIYYLRVQVTDSEGYTGPFTPARRFVVPLPWWTLLVPVVIAIPFL